MRTMAPHGKHGLPVTGCPPPPHCTNQPPKQGEAPPPVFTWSQKYPPHHGTMKGGTTIDPHCITTQGGKKIALRGGDGTETHLPNPPLPLLGRRAGRGVWAGAALPAVPGGGGGGSNPTTPTYMAQNDPHVALIILTTHMWGNIFS